MNALRVLIVGSDTPESERLCSVLEQAHHSVVPVPTFEQACEALLIQKFDAVLVTPALSSQAIGDFATQLRDSENNRRNASRTPVVSVQPAHSLSSPGSNGFVDAYLSAEHFQAAGFAQTVENLANALAPATPDSSSSLSELPIFDLAGFEAQVAYDRELMVEIIDLFLVERTHDLTEMSEALASQNLPQLMRSAHTIKGSLGSLHANLARNRSQELEIAAKAGNYQACIGLLTALEEDLNNLEPQLLSLRASAAKAK